MHMLFGGKTVRQQLGKGQSLVRIVRACQIDDKIVLAEFPHDLPADTAGGKMTGDDPVLAAADRNGRKLPMPVIHRFEKGCALGTNGGGEGSVLYIAALIDCAVSAKQCRADLKAGVGDIGVGHGFFGQFDELFGSHSLTSFLR